MNITFRTWMIVRAYTCLCLLINVVNKSAGDVTTYRFTNTQWNVKEKRMYKKVKTKRHNRCEKRMSKRMIIHYGPFALNADNVETGAHNRTHTAYKWSLLLSTVDCSNGVLSVNRIFWIFFVWGTFFSRIRTANTRLMFEKINWNFLWRS